MRNKSLKNNILKGMKNTLAICPTPPKNPTAKGTDMARLKKDTYKIGSDIYKAIGKVEDEYRRRK